MRAEGFADPRLDKKSLDSWISEEAKHNLHKLADRLDKMLTQLGEEKLPPDIHRVLVSLHQIDPTGETFRYAKVRGANGELVDAPRPLLSAPDEFQAHVDIAAMHEQFKAAFGLISGGLMTVLAEIREVQQDVYAEYQDW